MYMLYDKNNHAFTQVSGIQMVLSQRWLIAIP